MSQNARNRLGPQMVAIFGSVLRQGAVPVDVDVVYHGVTVADATACARRWLREHRPELSEHPIDLHEAEWLPPHGDQIPGRFAPLQAVEETDPVLAMMGPAPAVVVAYESLPRAIRYFARHGDLPEAWRLRVGLDGRETQDGYFGGGLAALRTAWTKIRIEDQGRLYGLLGPVFRVLLLRDPTAEEIGRMAKGFPGGGSAGIDWDPRDGGWYASTTHGPDLTVDAGGAIVPIAR